MKKITGIYRNNRMHWVGNGFPVRTLFSYSGLPQQLSPFLMLDYAGPLEFPPVTSPDAAPRGVGEHPHRGFETVTIVYKGGVAHRDSTGQGGTIGVGDVQWITAGAGILHEEFHSPDFTREGGELEMVQLWVNLPKRHKMTPPSYQAILSADIPVVELPDGAGQVRVIAGQYADAAGAARTFSPMDVWDVRLNEGKSATFDLPEGHTLGIVLLHGSLRVNGAELLREAEMALLGREGSAVHLEADSDATLLVLSGQPLDEPVVGQGPFVMNTREEIYEAIRDFNQGRFGEMPA